MIVVESKHELQVFLNQGGNVSIYQDKDGDHEACILIHPEDAKTVARAILAAAKQVKSGGGAQ